MRPLDHSVTSVRRAITPLGHSMTPAENPFTPQRHPRTHDPTTEHGPWISDERPGRNTARLFAMGVILSALVQGLPAWADPGLRRGRQERRPLATVETRPVEETDEEPSTRMRRAAASPAPVPVERLLQRYAHEPSVEVAQRAAVRLVMADPDLPRRWLRRAARAAWLPKLQLGTGLQRRREEGLDQQAGTASRLRAGATNQMAYEVKVSWDLPRLIFDSNTLKVVQQAQRIAELREQVVLQVTRLYFERRQVQLEIQLRPGVSPQAALRRELRLAELTALLNALTGGIFSPGATGSRPRRR